MDFSATIISWYIENKRVLPWRKTKHPYKIWLSEVILQQTQVKQGLPYYLRFIEKYPTIKDLAQAKEADILKMWQGLGYYSRAKNLLITAKSIYDEFGNAFPKKYSDLIKQKGIGDYTASAISSFSNNETHAVVDGNVYRLLSRFYGIEDAIDSSVGKKYFKSLAQEVLDKNDPGIHNQAIMEFGAMQCKPKNPDCIVCPLNSACMAFNQNRIELLPYKSKKTKVQEVYIYYMVFRINNYYFIHERDANSIWKNMFDFPAFEFTTEQTEKSILKKIKSAIGHNDFSIAPDAKIRKHQLSHRTIYAKFYQIRIDKLPSHFKALKKQVWNKMPAQALPRLIEKYLEDNFK